jgi:hypothetical protein
MLEDGMRARRYDAPTNPALSGSEGALVSVSISVDPRNLESLLEALSQVSFPINPQIYHDGAVVYVYADQRQESELATIVEFPAYAGQLNEVRLAVAAAGMTADRIRITGMLENIHSVYSPEPAPPGAAYISTYVVKRRALAAH